MPNLTDVALAGYSPLLWCAPSHENSHFLVSAPGLRRASFGRIRDLRTWLAWPGEAVRPHGAHPNVDVEVLLTLLRTSPKLAALDVAGTNLTVGAVGDVLDEVKSGLQELSVGRAADDDWLSRLPRRAPRLKTLKVAKGAVTMVGLARMAGEWLNSPNSLKQTLEIHLAKPWPPSKPSELKSHKSLDTLASDLQVVLTLVTEAQVMYLVRASKLHAHPGSGSVGEVMGEVLALWAGIPRVGAAGSRHAAGSVKGALGRWLEGRAEERARGWLEGQARVRVVMEE